MYIKKIVYMVKYFILPALLKYNWYIALYKWKVHDILIWYIYILKITIVVLADNSIMSHNYHFFFWSKHLICSINNFQVHSTILSTIVTMLWNRSQELIYLVNECLYPLINISPFPPFPLGNHHSTLWFYELNYYRSHIKWDHIVFVFLCLTYFT